MKKFFDFSLIVFLRIFAFIVVACQLGNFYLEHIGLKLKVFFSSMEAELKEFSVELSPCLES